MTSYIALIRKDAGSDYGVEFPDFAGCVTAGRSLDEARRMASQASALHIEGMVEDGAAIPEPASFDVSMADAEHAGAVAVPVDVSTKSRFVRINVTLPEDLIEQMGRVTANRSGFLAEAARARLKVA